MDLAKVAHSQVGNEVVGGISGGERRRLTVAMEIVHKPRILFLDEPTSGLDATSAQRLGGMLRTLSREGAQGPSRAHPTLTEAARRENLLRGAALCFV